VTTAIRRELGVVALAVRQDERPDTAAFADLLEQAFEVQAAALG
jgi:hypothetical protein